MRKRGGGSALLSLLLGPPLTLQIIQYCILCIIVLCFVDCVGVHCNLLEFLSMINQTINEFDNQSINSSYGTVFKLASKA